MIMITMAMTSKLPISISFIVVSVVYAVNAINIHTAQAQVICACRLVSHPGSVQAITISGASTGITASAANSMLWPITQ